MESDDFGSFTAADKTMNDDASDHQKEVEKLQKEKKLLEVEFGQKRAKFMELFKQKEDDLIKAGELLSEAQKEVTEKDEQVKRLRTEVDDIKTAVAISEATKEDYVLEIRRKYDEEVKSLQHIMKDAIEQAHQAAAHKFQQEHAKLIAGYEKLDKELQDTKQKLAQERDGLLASVTKTIQKKVGVVALGQSLTEQENLEDSMKKAQEDAEILKSVVLPLEEEIQSLKEQLHAANQKISQFEGKPLEDGSILVEGSDELDERLKELNQSLEVEKASRSDLEMYTAVLNTQKNVLQEDNEKLMNQLQEVVKYLEAERQAHNNLKQTWQMANDQFLQAQRLMMNDMRSMESVLTAEQQRQIEEMKKKDAEREADEKRLLEKEQNEKDVSIRNEDTDAALDSQQHDSKGSMTSLTSDELSKMEDDNSISINTPASLAASPAVNANTSLLRSQSNQSLQSITKELFDSGMQDTKSLSDEAGALRLSPDRSFHVPNLTEAQQKAITDPTPAAEASQSLIASIKAKAESFSTVGKRLVSEKEWDMMQKEVRTAREKLGRPCELCHNYESQLQSLQESERKSQDQIRTLERHLQAERQAMTNQQAYTEELENNLKTVAEQFQEQIAILTNKVQESEKTVNDLKQQYIHSQTDLQHHLRTLMADREAVQKELSHLQEENDSLVGKHSKHSQQLQEESINLPNNLEEMQLLLLKYREEIISAKVAKEHIEDNLKSELLFLKDQLLCEQQEKSNLEEAMSQEISQIQHELDKHKGLKSELDEIKKLKAELEGKVTSTDCQLRTIQDHNQKTINTLQSQVNELKNSKIALEAELAKMRAKVSSLQVDLDNSEAVQRDFVKLSQSLQIQLEKIRAAEHEVRWQHEEDIEECSNCRQPFSVTKRKHHCRHCGKIFCNDCLPKIVNSGPSLRPSRVCDVCHTILVRDATPYFSTELPQSPD
ncbi:hypothetical protein LSH36_986g00042 [Paralvinella palmiformis]|uniref:FYVE-type domain-containing protein n=1 Tax=Paralvinella palmiformis TaxID=53620 RepID=A0AAD9MQY3_9ANNE|nr:hypothetical protein LSH36_986g00042 [Paralvinella palmiformis]